MSEHILYIRGPADTGEEYKAQRVTERNVASLRKAGAAVTFAGGATSSIKLSEVEKTLQADAFTTLLVEARGGRFNKRHRLFTETNRFIYTDKLFQAVAASAGKKPINIFMVSGAASFNCQNVSNFLPPGSTFVSFDNPSDDEGSPLRSDGFALAHHPEFSFAENLFLRMLCHGLGDKPTTPVVTVSAGGPGRGDPCDLWDRACGECFRHSYKDFSTEALQRIDGRLDHLLSPERLSSALATIEIYKNAFSVVLPEITDDRTLVTFPFVLDEEHIKEDARAYGLLGPMCAAAYILGRDEIGAFQSQRPEFYSAGAEAAAHVPQG